MGDNMSKKLSDKHEQFCQIYAADPECNGSRAYAEVYPDAEHPEVGACQLLKNPNVRARIDELKRPAAEKLGITVEWILGSLKSVYEKCCQEKEVEIFDPTTKQMVGTGEYVFDSKGANKALELLGKHLAIFTEKKDITSNGKTIASLPVVQVVDPKAAELTQKLLNEQQQ